MEDLAENALNIYTDGSQYSVPRRQGGIGFVFITVNEHGEPVLHEQSPPGWKGASNNQMELQACIEALKIATGRHPPVELVDLEKIAIYSDSKYVVENYTQAIFEWSGNGWKKRGGAPVANHVQWKEFVKLARRVRGMRMRLEIHWVEGHKKDQHNQQADRLAKASAKTPSERMIRPTRVRRKLSPNKCVVGSVCVRGQYETIRIISDEYLPPPHRCYAYMYEVVALKSSDFQLVDKVTSEIQLFAGHSYNVRFNDDPKNPRIEEEVEIES